MKERDATSASGGAGAPSGAPVSDRIRCGLRRPVVYRRLGARRVGESVVELIEAQRYVDVHQDGPSAGVI
jgi:hypothetical protein